MAKNSVFLEPDSTICEKNYLIAKDPSEDEFSKYLSQTANFNQLPPKLVKPFPGFCVKTKENGTETKLFVNICTTDAIPPPADISVAELTEILQSEDEDSNFRIPMSIGDVHQEPDKQGNAVNVYDIAINTKFFEKIQSTQIFKEFFLAVAFEGLETKFNFKTAETKIIMKNKKCVGTLQVHRIQQREIDEKMGIKTLPTFDEMLGKGDGLGKRKIVEMVTENNKVQPKYRLFKKNTCKDVLFAEIYLPYVISHGEISVDVGEDRLILETTKGNYFLDTFVNLKLDQDKSSCSFNKENKFLTVTMPIKSY